MTNRSQLRQRYLRDSLPVRLGGLAANLARVRFFSENPAHGEVVARLVEESTWFIEDYLYHKSHFVFGEFP